MTSSTAALAKDSAERLRERVTELAPWFQNLDLGHGVVTAPEHFLGDYPRRGASTPASTPWR